MMSSERDDLLAAAVKEWIGAYHEGIRALPLRGDKSCVDFAHAAGCDDMQLPAKCPRRLLRARRERPRGCRAAEKRQELPPSDVRHEASSRPGVTISNRRSSLGSV